MQYHVLLNSQPRIMNLAYSDWFTQSWLSAWSKRVTWANIPQLKLGNIRGYSPIFKTDG